MTDDELSAGLVEDPRAIATAVVSQDALDDDLAARPPRHGPSQKRCAGRSLLIRQDFDIGDATVIVDGDVGKLPPHPARPLASIAVDPMADPTDASEGLDIEMEHVAERRPFNSAAAAAARSAHAAGRGAESRR
jgi:hypothetical protein